MLDFARIQITIDNSEFGLKQLQLKNSHFADAIKALEEDDSAASALDLVRNLCIKLKSAEDELSAWMSLACKDCERHEKVKDVEVSQ